VGLHASLLSAHRLTVRDAVRGREGAMACDRMMHTWPPSAYGTAAAAAAAAATATTAAEVTAAAQADKQQMG
jgi:hypothetical protein